MEFLIILGVFTFFIIVGAIILLSFVFKTAHALRRTAESQTVRTVVEIAKGIIDQKEELDQENEVQAPKSVSDLTSVYISDISRDFPETNVRELISAVENKLCLILTAIGSLSDKRVCHRISFPDSAYKMELESGFGAHTLDLTDDCILQVKRHVDELCQDNSIEHFDNIRVHHTGIHSYKKQGGTGVIALQTAISYIHYQIRDGKLVSGSKEKVEQARYDIQVIYIIDQEQLPYDDTIALSVHCPNCGAGIKGVGDKFCEFCGAEVKTIDIRLWRVNAFSES